MAQHSECPDDTIELHNAYPKLPFEEDLALKWKRLVSYVPIVNLVVTPLYMLPDAKGINGLLRTTLIVNALVIGRIFLKVDLTNVPAADAEEFKTYLSIFSKLSINAFSLNITLLVVLDLGNARRGTRRKREVWSCLRWGVVLLIWILKLQIIYFLMLYWSWGKIVYSSDPETFSIFGSPAGIALYAIMCICVVLSTLAIPGEVLLGCGEVYQVGLRKKGIGCEFIASLKDMPATQTTLSRTGMTYQRLKLHQDDPQMLLLILHDAGLPVSDCLDVIAAVQKYTKKA